MLSRMLIKDLATKQQTIETNIAREYCQHLMLSYIYRQSKSDGLLFKGGTCLRVLHNSPRFSEDLDFTGLRLKFSDMVTIFRSVMRNLKDTGLAATALEEKSTTGGYIGIYRFNFLDFDEIVKVECSFRKPSTELKAELYTVAGDYIPAFTVLSLPIVVLFSEKISALLTRDKPRDYYDIYFLLRSNAIRDKSIFDLGKIHQRLLKSKIDFKKELKPLLPKTHHNILNDFQNILLRELNRSGF
jgi:predicted nucleotidyltransferase component of viral defense system